jgi:hypothetical protein
MVNKRPAQPGDEAQGPRDAASRHHRDAPHGVAARLRPHQHHAEQARQDGLPIKEQAFDEHRLEVTKAGKVPFKVTLRSSD